MIYLIYIFFISALVFIDQFSKTIITTYFDLNESIVVIKNFFNLTYVQNEGAGFSIMQGARTTFLILTPICLALFIYLLLKSKKNNHLERISLVLLIAGTIGNFIDRIKLEYVIDFLDFIIFGWDFPVFNFADICLTIGAFFFIIALFVEEHNEKA